MTTYYLQTSALTEGFINTLKGYDRKLSPTLLHDTESGSDWKAVTLPDKSTPKHLFGLLTDMPGRASTEWPPNGGISMFSKKKLLELCHDLRNRLAEANRLVEKANYNLLISELKMAKTKRDISQDTLRSAACGRANDPLEYRIWYTKLELQISEAELEMYQTESKLKKLNGYKHQSPRENEPAKSLDPEVELQLLKAKLKANQFELRSRISEDELASLNTGKKKREIAGDKSEESPQGLKKACA